MNTKTFLLRTSPWLVFGILTVNVYLGIIKVNNGNFTYTLDDAYIHLSLAENLVNGSYGINPGEMCAPSSSIIFPYILAGALKVLNTDKSAFYLNIIFSLISIYFITKIVELLFPKKTDLFKAIITIMLLFTGNVVNLVFNGMEHSLQILFTLILLYGIIKEHYAGELNIFIYAGIIITPLIRYEALAFSFTTVLYLYLKDRKYFWNMFIAAIIMIIPIFSFSYFLHSNGLGILPSSIMIKTGASSSAYGIQMVIDELIIKVKDYFGFALLICLLIFIAYIIKFKSKENLLKGLLIILPIIGHFFLGKFRWFFRYEVYIFLASFIFFYFLVSTHNSKTGKEAKYMLWAIVLFQFLFNLQYMQSTFLAVEASNNIYEQQCQMHRFAADFYKDNIAVNDVGYVSYKNENYVLDLVGLASKEVVDYKKAGKDIFTLPEKHNIKLFIVYDSWYKNRPKNWIYLGKLKLNSRALTPAENEVAFFSTDSTAVKSLKNQLYNWSKELPGKSSFEFGI